MKIPVKYLIVASLLILGFSNCSKKGTNEPVPVIKDTTKPTISISNPYAGQSFVPGNTIVFQATFSDNEKLKNYEIAISKVVLGGLVLKNVPTAVPWSYTKPSTGFSFGVKQQDINLSDISIPLTINTNRVETGKYNFKVTCTDESSNIATTTLEININ